jgi:hypothetical protein
MRPCLPAAPVVRTVGAVSPLPSHLISILSQQGLWLDEEASSAGSREKPAQSGKNRSIRGPQGRTRHLSAQDGNFVAEH